MHKLRHPSSSLARHSIRTSLVLLTFTVGCSGDPTIYSPAVDPSSLYWNLRLDHHAVQLSLEAPYKTIQLTATPVTPSGDVWHSEEEIEGDTRWTSTDSAKVRVSSTGLVTAIAVTPGVVRILARRQIRNVTRVDTAQVRVVSELHTPTLTSLRIRPNSPDSAKIASGSSKLLFPLALGLGTDTLRGVVAHFVSSDTSVVKFSNAWSGSLSARRPGSSTITATTWVYGVAKTDTFTLVVGYPLTAYPSINRRRSADNTIVFYIAYDTVDLGPGATISFGNSSGGLGQPGKPIDVIFDNPSAVLPALSSFENTGGGNMMGIPSDTTITDWMQLRRVRRFVTPGTYTYRVEPFGLSGAVIIRPQ